MYFVTENGQQLHTLEGGQLCIDMTAFAQARVSLNVSVDGAVFLEAFDSRFRNKKYIRK